MATKGAGNPVGPEARCRELFFDALDMDDARRGAFLDAQCAGDDSLRRRVQTLLDHDRGGQRFLTRGAAERLGLDVPVHPLQEVGPYKVERVLGEGGFGVVYLAQQREPVVRMVALKVLKAGVDTQDVIRRFMLERQSMAMMDHPCIAKVLDAGATPDGQPFFVMEYVDGSRITEFCDAQGLTITQRVALMVEVCRAVQHAHQKGIIHRDLKPSNILVSTVDGVAMPRIIDFGVAKAVSGHVAGATRTGVEMPAIGTPDYMSPEQAGAPGGVDTRTDVYALGVVLYQMLAGVLPFDSPNTEHDGWLSRIREREPISPARRLSGIGDIGRTIADQRATTHPLLIRQLKGELAWIPLKAMANDATRRYGSAAEMAEDLERYLQHLPLRAGPPSRAYLLRKFLRRNRVVVSAVGAVVFALVLGLFVAARENTRAGEALVLARQEAARATVAVGVAQRERSEAESQAYVANLTAAAAAIRADDAGAARRALEDIPVKTRGWEWNHLRSRIELQQREDDVPNGITVLDVTPDGFSVAESLADGTARVRSVLTGETRWTAKELLPSLPMRCSPDGRFLAYGPGELVVRSIADGTAVTRVSLGAMVTSVAISPDSAHVFVGDDHNRISKVEIATGRIEWERRTDDVWVWALDARPDGREIAWGDRYKLVVADAETGVTKREFPISREADGWRDIRCLRYSPDGKSIAAGAGVSVQLLDAESGRCSQVLRGHTQKISWVAFDGEGKRLASAADDRTIRVWDVFQGAPLAVLRGHLLNVFSVAFADGGTRIMSSSRDHTIKTWDSRSRPDVRTFITTQRSNDTARRISFSADGSRLLMATSGQVQWWDLKSDAVGELPERCETCFDAAMVSPDGKILAAADREGNIRLIELPSGSLIITWKAHKDVVTRLVFSSDGKLLVSLGRDGRTLVWRSTDGRLLAERTSVLHDTNSVAFLADQETVVTIKDKDVVEMWQWRSDKTRLSEPAGDHRLEGLALSRDGRRIAATSLGGSLRLWDAASGKLLQSSRPADLGLRGIAFSPDGTRLAAAGLDGTVRILDAESLRELLALRGHEEWVDMVTWSPDGRRLVSADWDGTVRVWDSTPDKSSP